MVLKSSRQIQSKTIRSILTYSFFQFSQRLESKAKTIKSKGIVMDRDINGARGIFLRALVDSPWIGLSNLAVGRFN